jgi:hypothetical protein
MGLCGSPSTCTFLPIDREPTIYVVRKEFLWQDWLSVNKALGQKQVWVPPRGDDHRRDVSAVHQPVGRELDPRRQSIFCAALQKDYDAYLWFLRKANNLQPSDIDESVAIMHKNCPQVKVV